jgi:DNA-binding PadR family transcriptional regulator
VKQAILDTLAQRPEQSGAELSDRLKIGSGTLYPLLFELEQEGKIVYTRWNEERHTYRLATPNDRSIK